MYIVDPRRVHILQICARNGINDCTRYVTPARAIEKGAGQVNGISFNSASRVMTYKGTKVRHISLHNALLDFLSFLSGIRNPVLVAHNGKQYDFIILYRIAAYTGLLPRFRSSVYGFLDTLPLCRHLVPGHCRHSLKTLYADLVGDHFEAHDAKQDCIALEKVLDKLRTSLPVLQRFSFGWETVTDQTLRDRLS